jgi:ribonucleoside-diphosphate reductase alpha chain
LTFDYESQGLPFTASYSPTADELFIRNHKAGSMAGINASDAAVLFSIARQYGAPLDVLRKALMRDSQGHALGPVGAALDRIAAEKSP